MNFRSLTVKEAFDNPTIKKIILDNAPNLGKYPIKLFNKKTCGEIFDLVVSNPPYIPSSDCGCLQPEVMKEPRLALDGGKGGCDLYRRIAVSAPSVLVFGGKLLMELGIGEAGPVAGLLADSGYTGIQTRKDYAGIDRMILAVRP